MSLIVFNVIFETSLYMIRITRLIFIHVYTVYMLILESYCLYCILICHRYHELCLNWHILIMFLNCVVVYGRTACKTAFGWWAILVKYVFNKLRTSDTMCRHKSWSTLAQVKACFLTAPSNYYLDHCLTITKCVVWHSTESNFTRNYKYINP